uniref:Uncharacterized protein n=1 Tax=Arundo donax TaxID=35708 RepID=A0A0A8Y685_ARUDO
MIKIFCCFLFLVCFSYLFLISTLLYPEVLVHLADQ